MTDMEYYFSLAEPVDDDLDAAVIGTLGIEIQVIYLSPLYSVIDEQLKSK
jgi:hypothetical protein